MELQVKSLFGRFDVLQKLYGDPGFTSIYGAGQIKDPQLMLIFMNPTGRNVASMKSWGGIRGPWIGTKQVWKLFCDVGLLSESLLNRTLSIKNSEWTTGLAEKLYISLAKHGVYVTNFAKCTLSNARPLSNLIYRKYKSLLEDEILITNPQKIVTFGNQVSSNLLSRSVSVSKYLNDLYEEININGKKYKIYPSYYPVGQGRRNMPLAIERLHSIIKKSSV